VVQSVVKEDGVRMCEAAALWAPNESMPQCFHLRHSQYINLEPTTTGKPVKCNLDRGVLLSDNCMKSPPPVVVAQQVSTATKWNRLKTS
jgi:hypothetical protein